MTPASPIIIGQSLFNIANGSTKFVPNGIQNPRAGMWVDELRFLVTMKGAVQGIGQQTILHDAVRFQVKVGKTELTSGYVGAALIAGVRDWAVDTTFGLATFTELGIEPAAFGVGVYTWRFPKPMYLPSNGVLDIAMQQQDDMAFTPARLMNVDIAAVCRTVPRGQEPTTVDVPFAANWFGDVLVNPGGTNNPGAPGVVLSVVASAVQQSSSHDLRNRFRVPLHVTRMAATQWAKADFENGAAIPGLATQQSGPEVSAWIGGGVALVPEFNGNVGADSPTFQPTKLQILDQDGHPIVRDMAPPGAIFAYVDRAWRIDALIPPNGYYMVDSTTVLTSACAATRVAVGMIGYRTIPVAELGVAE